MLEKQERLGTEVSALDAILTGWQERTEHEAIAEAYEQGKATTVDEAMAYVFEQV